MILWLLVLAQFVLAAFLVLSTRWSPFPWLVSVCATPGAALAIWAWFRVGLRKLRVHPDTTDRTELITGGPYSIVRHPMYAGLLWFTLPLLFQPWRMERTAAWLALAAVLFAKTVREEASLIGRFATYSEYRERVGRLCPRLIRPRS